MLMKGGVKPITELLKAVKELFADSKGKWSSKRTISGVIVLAASLYIEKNGIDTNALILTGLGVLPLCFSVFEKKQCDCNCGLKNNYICINEQGCACFSFHCL